MRRPFLLLAFLLIALGAEAAVTKHKEWLQSPEAYFATDAERKQWRSIDSDEQAEAFLAKFRQRRGGEAFTRMVKKRVSSADAVFPHDHTRGSETVRGKLVILFGSPRSIDLSPAKPPRGGGSAGRALGGAGRAAPRTSALQPDPYDRVVTLTFGGESHPAFVGEDYVIHFDVDSGSGKDRPAKGTDQKRLDALIEAVIAAAIVDP